MKQHIEFDIEWPEEENEPMWYVAPSTASCMHTLGFFGRHPDRSGCHIIIERPHEVCGKAWLYDAAVDKWYPGNGSACTLDAVHDGPCMMELGEAE